MSQRCAEAATQPGSPTLNPTPRSPLSQGRSIAIKGTQAGEDDLGLAATQAYAPTQAWPDLPQTWQEKSVIVTDETLDCNIAATQVYPVHGASPKSYGVHPFFSEVANVSTASSSGACRIKRYQLDCSLATQAYPEAEISGGCQPEAETHSENTHVVHDPVTDESFCATQSYPDPQLEGPLAACSATQAYSADEVASSGVVPQQDPPATQVYAAHGGPCDSKMNIFDNCKTSDKGEPPMTQSYTASVPFVPKGPVLDVLDCDEQSSSPQVSGPSSARPKKREISHVLGAAPKYHPAPSASLKLATPAGPEACRGKRRVASPATAAALQPPQLQKRRRSSDKKPSEAAPRPQVPTLVTPRRRSACQALPWTPLRRLRGKQPPPKLQRPRKSKPDREPSRSAAAKSKAKKSDSAKDASKAEPELCSSQLTQGDGAWLRQVGYSFRPAELGQQVEVLGDGWGNGEDSYLAVVTEADRFTFTVVAVAGASAWSQAHVLREHCVLKSGQRGSSSEETEKCHKVGSDSSVMDCDAVALPLSGREKN